MRITLTIDDDVVKLLESACRSRNTSLKEVINEALRQGLREMHWPHQDRKSYETRAVSLGRCFPGNLDNIAEVIAIAESETFK